MVKVLHAADFHLDSAFGALSEERSRQRRQECRRLVDRMVDYANDHGAELMLLSGDLFDGERVYAQTAEELAAALGRFRGAVVIAPGNHDPYTTRSPYARTAWPENVHIFKTDSWERLAFPQYGCTVYGAAFTAGEADAPEELAVGDEGVRLLVLHGDVGHEGSRYRVLTTAWLARTGVDYAALGHVHEHRGVQHAGTVAYAYPGCPEGRGFDELGEKGFLFGTVDRGRADMQFVSFAARRYAVVTVDVTDADVGRAAADGLRGREEDIVRLILTGEVEVAVDVQVLTQQLSGLCWQLEIRDETRLRQDLWCGCGEESLRGLFLQNLREEYDRADAEGRATIEQAVRFGLAALENREL